MNTDTMHAMWNFMYYIIQATVCISVCDKILIHINSKHIRESTRWFQLHSIMNCIITWFAYPDVVECLFYPQNSNQISNNNWSRSFALSLHIYHSIVYTLRYEDWMHHILSVFLTAPFCIINNTKNMSVVYFFCTGLPGAIDYFMLNLVRTNYILKKRQKTTCSIINAYLRMPGGCYGGLLLLKDSYHAGVFGIDKAIMALVFYCNSVYYGKQAIESATKI